MKKSWLVYVIFGIGILFSADSYACKGGGCIWSCVDRDFHLVWHCCKKGTSDCLDKEMPTQKCGEGEFLEYPEEQRECCNASLTECNRKLDKKCLRCRSR